MPALGADRGRLPPGHYRIAGIVEHGPWSADEGPARIALADLDSAAVTALVDAGRAHRREGDALLEIGAVVGPLGGLGGAVGLIHGGGTGADRLAPLQRLSPPAGAAVRVRNADLVRIVALLDRPSTGVRINVLSVLDDA